MGTFGRTARYRFAAGNRPVCQLEAKRLPAMAADLEHLRNLQSDLVTLAQSTLSDKLDNLGKILLFLQNLLGSCSEVNETRVDFFVVGVKDLEVLGVGDAGC